jgi:hypothetical protein
MEHLIEINDLFYGIGGSRLLAVPECGVRDEDLLRRIDEDETIVEFDPADLLVGKNMPVKVRLLAIQKWKLDVGCLALKCFFLFCDSHFSSSR